MANFNQEETIMSASLGMGMWRVFSTTYKTSAQVLFRASKTSVIETGRATATTGLVILGFFAYDRATALFQPKPQSKNSAEDRTINLALSPK